MYCMRCKNNKTILEKRRKTVCYDRIKTSMFLIKPDKKYMGFKGSFCWS